jgi:adenylate cyclase
VTDPGTPRPDVDGEQYKRVERRLSAIVAADVVGYSRLMEKDEEGTLGRLKAHRRDLIDPTIARHNGRIVKTTGDGVLVEFASVIDAVRSAVEVQQAMAQLNVAMSSQERLEFRIGINLGDVIIDEGDIFGDAVNIACRLQGLAQPGGIWVSRVVSEQIREKLAIGLVDHGEWSVKNIERPIHAFGLAVDASVGQALPRTAYVINPAPRLSIIVLPFSNLSGDPEQEYFADSLVEDLTTDLSRIAGTFVIARNTAFTYKGRAVDVKEVGRDVGVNYVLEGSVRRVGGHVRINAQLIDSQTGGHLWADRFDGDVGNLFALQDSIIANLAMALSVELVEAAARQASRKSNPDSVDLVMRARAAARRPRRRENALEAQGYYEQALKIAPGSPEARTGLAEVLVGKALSLLSADRDADLVRAEELVSQVLAEHPNSAWAHYVKGEILRCLRCASDAAREYERAIALDRNYAPATANLGFARVLMGQPAEALPLLERAIRMSPRDPLLAIWHSRIGQAEMYLARYESAKAALQTALGLNPGLAWSHFYLAAVYALNDNNEKAAASLAEAQRLSPELSSVARYKAISQISHPALQALREQTLIPGLRLAGLPVE